MSDAHHTFLFADLAGFTALTEVHGDERAADLAIGLCAALNGLLPDDAEDFKMVGDACLVRLGDPAEAVRLGLRLAGRFAYRHEALGVRVGMHTGTALRRGEDWFGSTVNRAARVAELAGSGDVLLTEATRASAGRPAGVVFEDLDEHELRHVAAPVRLLRACEDAVAPSPGRWVVDPVCRMQLDVTCAATSATHEGDEAFFCSALCADLFVRAPARHLDGVSERTLEGAGRARRHRTGVDARRHRLVEE